MVKDWARSKGLPYRIIENYLPGRLDGSGRVEYLVTVKVSGSAFDSGLWVGLFDVEDIRIVEVLEDMVGRAQ